MRKLIARMIGICVLFKHSKINKKLYYCKYYVTLIVKKFLSIVLLKIYIYDKISIILAHYCEPEINGARIIHSFLIRTKICRCREEDSSIKQDTCSFENVIISTWKFRIRFTK